MSSQTSTTVAHLKPNETAPYGTMRTPSLNNRKPTHATFNYYDRPDAPEKDDLSILYSIRGSSPVVLPIYDIRSSSIPFHVDTHGFQPLGMVDAKTIPASEWVGLKRTYSQFEDGSFKEKFEGENLFARLPSKDKIEAGESHQWYWLSEQRPDEVTVIKIFDSEALKEGSTVAGMCPHSSFEIEGTEDEPARRSVELRVVATW